MVTYADLSALVDVLKEREDEASVNGLQTLGILLGEITEYRKQASLAGMGALMASLYKELGEPVPESNAKQLAAKGLGRIRELFAEVNVLFEENEFSCRFDFGEDDQSGFDVLMSQVEWISSEMMENGIKNYLNRKK